MLLRVHLSSFNPLCMRPCRINAAMVQVSMSAYHYTPWYNHHGVASKIHLVRDPAVVQVSGSGTPLAVEAELLGQLHARLRAKAALRALQLAAEQARALGQLLDCREGLAGPLAAAAWRCWRRAAANRVKLRERVRATTQARCGGDKGLLSRVEPATFSANDPIALL